MAVAAASRSRRRQAQPSQPGLSTTFARVSKNTIVAKSEKDKSIAGKKLALEKLEQQEQQQQQQTPRPSLPITPANNKRKRDDSDSEDDGSSITVSVKGTKKSKLQLPTPPCSTPERATPETVVPAAVAELVEINQAFLKAFAIHRAHNGASAPAELGQLLESVTRLYRKRIVSVMDLQRMLGLFEIDTKLAATTLHHAKSPFKLLISGMGGGRRQSVEFVGYEKQSRRNGRTVTVKVLDFSDKDLQTLYETNAECVHKHRQLNGSVKDFPILEFSIGSQTIARQHKASETRKLILDGRKPDLDFGKLSVKDDSEPDLPKATVKSRTLSLFDRVKAKQVANAAVKAPSPEDLRRKHAIGRVAEVVEILRMKQQQKLRGSVLGKKASFALSQMVAEVSASLGIPMGNAEIEMCLEIVARQVGDGWCVIFELGTTRSLVLSGLGKSGKEVEALLKGKQ